MKLKIFTISILIGSYIIIASLVSPTICIFKNITGIPCPACGITRAYLSLFHGDIKKAFQFHPLFLLPLIILVNLIYMKIKVNRFIVKEKLVIVFIILIFVVYVIRMIYFFPNYAPMDINYYGAIPRGIKIIRHLQKNNKPAYGLFCTMLHCHNPYIGRLCSGYVASPGTKYPHKLCLVIFFQMPK